MLWVCLLVGSPAWATAVEETIPTPKPGPPSIEEYATIEGYCQGAPIYSFSNIDYVYGIGLDLYPGAKMQEGNTYPVEKVPPKNSWEIKHNYMGSNHAITVRSAWTDSQPLLPIHLIDGDRDTVWSSWGSTLNGVKIYDWHPEWIRIDLPVESTVASVAMVCSKDFPQQHQGFGKVTSSSRVGTTIEKK